MSKTRDGEVMQVAKALGDPSRFSIYQQIARGEETYCGEICDRHTLSPGTVSHHLKVLADAGLIASRKEGLNVYYRTLPETFARYLEYLAQLQK